MTTSLGARTSFRRKLFAPEPLNSSASTSIANTQDDADLAAALSAAESTRSYSLRRRLNRPILDTSSEEDDGKSHTAPTSAGERPRRESKRVKTEARRSRAITPESDSGSDFEDGSYMPAAETTPEPTSSKKRGGTSTPSPTKKKSTSKAASTKSPASPFDVSPRKKQKPIKIDLEEHEAHPAPARWQEVYDLLAKQRAKIVAPVDTMGCEENGRDDRRADSWRQKDTKESAEEAARRERLATLVSLMLSSQTKDPVTAEAVYNLQRNLPNGLCLQSLLEADDEAISSCINKVGFWRRKTGYLKSAARILQSDFDGDVPRTVDDLCSLPGVGPKMAFLALSSMGIQVGIGVDTHVHRLTNRLGWHTTKTPEETRLNLQSWLPKPLHGKINRLLVGFGQVICVPVGPRCDLCSVGEAGLCPSFRQVDAKSALKRVKVHLLDSDNESGEDYKNQENWVKVKKEQGQENGEPKVKVEVEVELEGPEGKGMMQIEDLTHTSSTKVKEEVLDALKQEDEEGTDAATVEKALEW